MQNDRPALHLLAPLLAAALAVAPAAAAPQKPAPAATAVQPAGAPHGSPGGVAPPPAPGAGARPREAKAAQPDAASIAAAKQLYLEACEPCHGASGAGNGAAAVGLPVRPRSFADPTWQRETSDEQIDRAIVGGGAAVAKSPLMPPNPDLEDRPAVVAALRALIRGFARASH